MSSAPNVSIHKLCHSLYSPSCVRVSTKKSNICRIRILRYAYLAFMLLVPCCSLQGPRTSQWSPPSNHRNVHTPINRYRTGLLFFREVQQTYKPWQPRKLCNYRQAVILKPRWLTRQFPIFQYYHRKIRNCLVKVNFVWSNAEQSPKQETVCLPNTWAPKLALLK